MFSSNECHPCRRTLHSSVMKIDLYWGNYWKKNRRAKEEAALYGVQNVYCCIYVMDARDFCGIPII